MQNQFALALDALHASLLLGLGDWLRSLTATDIGNLINLLTGLGTLALAFFAFRQARDNRRLIKLGERQAATAEAQAKNSADSVKVALEVQQEAIRARADQDAPRVTVDFSPAIGPLVDGHRDGMPNAGQLRLLDPQSIERSQPLGDRMLAWPRNRDTFIWYRGFAVLTNEGRTSARVRLPSEAVFVEEDDQGSPRLPLPKTVTFSAMQEAVLPPGAQARFMWGAGKPLHEWIDGHQRFQERPPGSAIWQWIVAFDPRDNGVIDTILALLEPEPVQKVVGEDGAWEARRDASHVTVHVLPIKRGYRFEGAATEDLSAMYDHHGVDKYGNRLVSGTDSD
ncbi:hypothetical protein JD276_08835 [Leucobacter sp. CSA1]|uniref:Uncharacterized protein n=1 Tax=Leucobacter chromiisoli TaxID=2796471 RepID=A0A934Q7I3_9MICO|nr:hypothetical protein [Leucobacter chromiisoli]MBK0419138.1 hypothetical protein [Leucobacter chromiisoli]